MNKRVRIIAIVLGAIFFVIVAAVLYVHFSGIPSYPVEPVALRVHRNPRLIARGQKLVSVLCAKCHLNRETGRLSGRRLTDIPPEFGEVHSPNITRHPTYGIGGWTDGEILYLLRTGIKRDGTYTPPYMPKFPLMADADIHAIIAFLRSDHPMVAADPTPSVPCRPSLLAKFLCRVAFKPFPMPSRPIPMPDSTDPVALGEYLAHNMDCFSCHSADFKTNDYLNPRKSKGYFAGGNRVYNEAGEVLVSPNLTPDRTTGIGTWSRAAFIRTVRFGVRPDGSPLRYPMLPYPQLTDAEVGAIYDYLRTLKPVVNAVGAIR